MKKIITFATILLTIISCTEKKEYDATGRFEATEVVVSAETAGKIEQITITEGDRIEKGEIIGYIDSTQLYLLKKQLTAQLNAQLSRRPDIQKQVSTLKEQINKGKKEQKRFRELLSDNAVTQKQYDDIESNVKILESQLDAMLATLTNNTAAITSNAVAIEAKIAQTEDNIARCKITVPVAGTVMAKYAEEGEYAVPGKPLLKIADLEKMYIRAYLTSTQLSQIKIGDEVTVTADFGGTEQTDYKGKIEWISSESEFTPKTIQTKDSRANLVYAVKISVENDGRLKIGLYGNVTLKK